MSQPVARSMDITTTTTTTGIGTSTSSDYEEYFLERSWRSVSDGQSSSQSRSSSIRTSTTCIGNDNNMNKNNMNNNVNGMKFVGGHSNHSGGTRSTHSSTDSLTERNAGLMNFNQSYTLNYHFNDDNGNANANVNINDGGNGDDENKKDTRPRRKSLAIVDGKEHNISNLLPSRRRLTVAGGGGGGGGPKNSTIILNKSVSGITYQHYNQSQHSGQNQFPTSSSSYSQNHHRFHNSTPSFSMTDTTIEVDIPMPMLMPMRDGTTDPARDMTYGDTSTSTGTGTTVATTAAARTSTNTSTNKSSATGSAPAATRSGRPKRLSRRDIDELPSSYYTRLLHDAEDNQEEDGTDDLHKSFLLSYDERNNDVSTSAQPSNTASTSTSTLTSRQAPSVATSYESSTSLWWEDSVSSLPVPTSTSMSTRRNNNASSVYKPSSSTSVSSRTATTFQDSAASSMSTLNSAWHDSATATSAAAAPFNSNSASAVSAPSLYDLPDENDDHGKDQHRNDDKFHSSSNINNNAVPVATAAAAAAAATTSTTEEKETRRPLLRMLSPIPPPDVSPLVLLGQRKRGPLSQSKRSATRKSPSKVTSGSRSNPSRTASAPISLSSIPQSPARQQAQPQPQEQQQQQQSQQPPQQPRRRTMPPRIGDNTTEQNIAIAINDMKNEDNDQSAGANSSRDDTTSTETPSNAHQRLNRRSLPPRSRSAGSANNNNSTNSGRNWHEAQQQGDQSKGRQRPQRLDQQPSRPTKLSTAPKRRKQSEPIQIQDLASAQRALSKVEEGEEGEEESQGDRSGHSRSLRQNQLRTIGGGPNGSGSTSTSSGDRNERNNPLPFQEGPPLVESSITLRTPPASPQRRKSTATFQERGAPPLVLDTINLSHSRTHVGNVPMSPARRAHLLKQEAGPPVVQCSVDLSPSATATTRTTTARRGSSPGLDRLSSLRGGSANNATGTNTGSSASVSPTESSPSPAVSPVHRSPMPRTQPMTISLSPLVPPKHRQPSPRSPIDRFSSSTGPGNSLFSQSDSNIGYDHRASTGSTSSSYQSRRNGATESQQQQQPAPQQPTSAVIEVAPGEFENLRGSEETHRLVRLGGRSVISSVTCLLCEQRFDCLSDCKYVLCPYCQILNPVVQEDDMQLNNRDMHGSGRNELSQQQQQQQQQQQRRRRNGNSSSSILLSEPSGVGLGFHIQDILRTIQEQDRNNGNNRSFSTLGDDDGKWRQRQPTTTTTTTGGGTGDSSTSRGGGTGTGGQNLQQTPISPLGRSHPSNGSSYMNRQKQPYGNSPSTPITPRTRQILQRVVNINGGSGTSSSTTATTSTTPTRIAHSPRRRPSRSHQTLRQPSPYTRSPVPRSYSSDDAHQKNNTANHHHRHRLVGASSSVTSGSRRSVSSSMSSSSMSSSSIGMISSLPFSDGSN